VKGRHSSLSRWERAGVKGRHSSLSRWERAGVRGIIEII
jgi:hypothetical protein